MVSVILYSPPKLAKRISLVVRQISLRSNITRRKANITEKDDCESNRLFLVGAGGYSVPAPFRPLRAVLETFCVARDFTDPKCYRAFCAASTYTTFGGSHPFGFFISKQKTNPFGLVHCFGGSGWIRTTEVEDNRFTVCPLWPLGNTPIFSYTLELVDGRNLFSKVCRALGKPFTLRT